MAFPTTSVLDAFTRANGAAGSNWLAGFGDTLPSINSNALKGSAAGWYGAVWSPSGTPASFSAPQEAFYTVTAADASSAQQVGLVVRGTALNGGSYSGYMAHINGGQLRITKLVSGSFTLLATGSTITLAAGDKLGIEVVGTTSPVTINLYYAPAGVWPGTPSLTFSDSSTPLTTGGQIGLSWNQTAANSNGADDFGGGTTSAGTVDKPVSESYTMSDSSAVGIPDKSGTDSGTYSETSTVNSTSTTVEGTLSESSSINIPVTDGGAVTDASALSTGTDKAGIEGPTFSEAAVVTQFVNLVASDGATGAEAVAGANAPTTTEGYTVTDAGTGGTTVAGSDSGSLTTELASLGGIAPPPPLKMPLAALVTGNLASVTVTPNTATVEVTPNIATVEVG